MMAATRGCARAAVDSDRQRLIVLVVGAIGAYSRYSVPSLSSQSVTTTLKSSSLVCNVIDDS